MSQDKCKTSTKRSATEYRLSITSNPGSRRSSLSGTNENGHVGSNGGVSRTGVSTAINDEDENIVRECILPQIRELSDSIITLDANFTQLNFIHESLVDFNESLGALLYGLMCNSWCVDFPFVSHDIAGELEMTERLESLALEKQSLLLQLNKMKNQDNKGSATNNAAAGGFQRSQFAQPMLPAMQAKRTVQRRMTSPQKRDLDTDDEEDEINSEASFISNPTMDLSKRHEGNVNKATSKSMSRLRRKSILHTIRNSVASAADFKAENNNRVNTYDNRQHGDRMSLGGGATRVFTNSLPSNGFKAMAVNKHPSRISSSARETKTVPRPVNHRQQTSFKRPPFR